MLKADTLKIQTEARNDTTKHVYVSTYAYDVDGRRTQLHIPWQLRAATNDAITYGYEAETGLLDTLQDLQLNKYFYGYDFKGQLTSVTYPGRYSQKIAYDSVGQVMGDTIHNDSSTVPPRVQFSFVRQSTFQWDARNKLLQSVDPVGFQTQMLNEYTGLGYLKTAYWHQYGCWGCDLGPYNTNEEIDTLSQDALGNRRTSTARHRVLQGINIYLDKTDTQNLGYEPSTVSCCPSNRDRSPILLRSPSTTTQPATRSRVTDQRYLPFIRDRVLLRSRR